MIVAASLGVLGLTMVGITIHADKQQAILATFSFLLLLVAILIAYGGVGEFKFKVRRDRSCRFFPTKERL